MQVRRYPQRFTLMQFHIQVRLNRSVTASLIALVPVSIQISLWRFFFVTLVEYFHSKSCLNISQYSLVLYECTIRNTDFVCFVLFDNGKCFDCFMCYSLFSILQNPVGNMYMPNEKR